MGGGEGIAWKARGGGGRIAATRSVAYGARGMRAVGAASRRREVDHWTFLVFGGVGVGQNKRDHLESLRPFLHFQTCIFTAAIDILQTS